MRRFLEVRADKWLLGIIDDEHLYTLARVTLPSQFAVFTIDLGNIASEIIELLRIMSFNRVQFIHRTAEEFLRKNKQAIKLIKDYSTSFTRKSISRLNAFVGSWRLVGCSSPQRPVPHFLESWSAQLASLQTITRPSSNSAPKRLALVRLSPLARSSGAYGASSPQRASLGIGARFVVASRRAGREHCKVTHLDR